MFTMQILCHSIFSGQGVFGGDSHQKHPLTQFIEVKHFFYFQFSPKVHDWKSAEF